MNIWIYSWFYLLNKLQWILFIFLFVETVLQNNICICICPKPVHQCLFYDWLPNILPFRLSGEGSGERPLLIDSVKQSITTVFVEQSLAKPVGLLITINIYIQSDVFCSSVFWHALQIFSSFGQYALKHTAMIKAYVNYSAT